jgi:hypothetical protein
MSEIYDLGVIQEDDINRNQLDDIIYLQRVYTLMATSLLGALVISPFMIQSENS